MKPAAEKTLGNRYFVFLIRLVLGFIFVFAAIEKIAQPEDFARAIMNYRLLPTAIVNIFAIALPWIELLAGLLLLVGVLSRGSSFVLAFLLGLFLIAIGISLARGLDISCGCFGTTDARKVGWAALGEDFLMLLGSLLLYYFPSSFATVEAYILSSTGQVESATTQ